MPVEVMLAYYAQLGHARESQLHNPSEVRLLYWMLLKPLQSDFCEVSCHLSHGIEAHNPIIVCFRRLVRKYSCLRVLQVPFLRFLIQLILFSPTFYSILPKLIHSIEGSCMQHIPSIDSRLFSQMAISLRKGKKIGSISFRIVGCLFWPSQKQLNQFEAPQHSILTHS